jgi:hypothetical protein
MDDIEEGKIGKKDEKLVGWDHIRKPKMGTNYPPMRVKDDNAPGTGLPWTYIPPKEEKHHFDFNRVFDFLLTIIFLVVSVVLIIFALKILGYW